MKGNVQIASEDQLDETRICVIKSFDKLRGRMDATTAQGWVGNSTALDRLIEQMLPSAEPKEKALLQIPPQMKIRMDLKPLHLFIINKNGLDVSTLLSAMEDTYFVSDFSRGMMNQAQYFIIGPPETTIVGVYTCDQLGVTGWPETDFFGPKGWEHIKKFGLAKCLPDDGQYVRLAHSKQELGEWFMVGHDSIPFGGYSRVWSVGHGRGRGLCLSGWNLCSGYRLGAGGLVALRLAH